MWPHSPLGVNLLFPLFRLLQLTKLISEQWKKEQRSKAVIGRLAVSYGALLSVAPNCPIRQKVWCLFNTHTHPQCRQMHSVVHLLIEMSPKREREGETVVAGTASLDACHNYSLTLILLLAVRLISIILSVGLFSFTDWSLRRSLHSLVIILALGCFSFSLYLSLSYVPFVFFWPSLYFVTFDLWIDREGPRCNCAVMERHWRSHMT